MPSIAMSEIQFSERADADLKSIAEYTVRTFGVEQASLYRDQFSACFRSIAQNPQLGRSAEKLAPGLRRTRQQAHVIFFLPNPDAVLIVRVLHERMDHSRPL